MKALILSHKGFLGVTARLFDDANLPLVMQRLTSLGFTFDGVSLSRQIGGSPTAVAAIVDVADNGFIVDGGCGKLEADLRDQVFEGFDLLAVLNVELPAWYSAYLASLTG